MGLWDVIKGVYDTISYPLTKPAEYVYDYLTGDNVNRANKEIAQQTNQANLELYNKQHEDSVVQWNAENAYNTPIMQSARLRAAGLNPALMNGSNATGVASALSSSMPTPHPAVGYDYRSPMANASDLFNNLSMASEAFKSFQQGQTSRLGNQFVEQEHIKGLAQMDANIDYLLKQTKVGSMQYWFLKSQKRMLDLDYKMSSETFDTRKQGFDLENQLKQAQLGSIEEATRVAASQRALNESLTALHKTENVWFGKTAQAAIDKMYQEISVGKATVRNLSADTIKKQFESAGLRISNNQARQILPYIVKQAQYLPTFAEQQYRQNEIERFRTTYDYYQKEQDLGNPFNYLGKLLGSGGAAPFVKAVK